MSFSPKPPGSHGWPTTQWLWLEELQTSDDEALRKQARERLCAAYNRPVFASLRQLGFSPEDAEDARQEFFVVVIDGRDLFQQAKQPRGRLRDFLRQSLKHFAANIYRKRSAEKRGGDAGHESLSDFHTSSALGGIAPAPDEIFDREWATGLLERALDRLGEECAANGRADLWQELRPHLARWDSAEPQAVAAARFGLKAGALNSELHRLRIRAGRIIRVLISETAAGPQEAEDDLRYFYHLLTR